MNRYKSPISVTHPELAAEAVGWDSSTLTAGSDKKMGWQCEYGHKWNASVSSRSKGSGCPVCSGLTALAGFNDLATTYPELAAQAYAWDPTTLSAGSNKKMGWQCEYGHKWNASVYTRSKGSGCPVCSGLIVLAGFNDLATVNPELAAQADGWDPATLSAGSGRKVSWKCQLRHTWDAAVRTRSNGHGCPICSNKSVLAGYNDLATINPELAAQAHDWDPTTLTAYSGFKVDWKCEQGHTWNADVHSRSSKGHGCPVCSNRKVLVGFNDLATTNPELAAQAYNWDPTTLTGKSTIRVDWRCKKGHRWRTAPGSRTGRDVTGCPTCAPTGFDPNQPGWLYLIENDELDMFEIGISNFPENRIGQHSKRGWEVMEVRGPMEGNLARGFEISILKSLKTRGAIMAHKTDIGKFDGWTEAWTKDSLPVTSFKQLLDWVYQDDEKQLMTKAL